MDVLIKSMEMPTSCIYCPMLEGEIDDGLCHAASRWLDDEEYWLWYQYPEGDIDTSKPSNCPLVPIPPHGRLIDADELKELFRETITGIATRTDMKGAYEHMIRASAMVIEMIDDAPTVIEASEDGEQDGKL